MYYLNKFEGGCLGHGTGKNCLFMIKNDKIIKNQTVIRGVFYFLFRPSATILNSMYINPLMYC